MFQNILLTVVAFITLGSIAVTAADTNTYTYGPYIAVGYDPDRSVARREAFDVLQAAVTDLEQILPEGDEPIGVITTHTWDGITFELTYTIVVFDGEP